MPYNPANTHRLLHSYTQNSKFERSVESSGNSIYLPSLGDMWQENVNNSILSKDASSLIDSGRSKAIPVSLENGKWSEIHLETKEDSLDSVSALLKIKQMKEMTISAQKGKTSQSVSASSAIDSLTDDSSCNKNEPSQEVVESGSVAVAEADSVARPSGIHAQPLSSSNRKCYVCDVCGKVLRTSSLLIEHYRTHTGEKQFVCNICKTSFRTKGHLNVHLRTHTGTKPFECLICQKRFATNSNCKAHIFTHLNKKHFACAICNKVFEQKSHLQSHLQGHGKEKL